MNYTQFKQYITTFLWRQNDTEIANALDTLIMQANTELTQLTRNWQRRQRTALIMPESQDFNVSVDLPDFESVNALVSNTPDTYFTSNTNRLEQAVLSQVYEARAKYPNGPLRGIYGIDQQGDDKIIRFVANFSADNPGDLTLMYRNGLPNYLVDNASWFADEYLNLYLYTVMKHCAMFLRDEKRQMQYQAAQAEAFQLGEMDDKHNLQFGGSPLKMRPHRAVP